MRSGTNNKGIIATGTQNVFWSHLTSCVESHTHREPLMWSHLDIWISCRSSQLSSVLHKYCCGREWDASWPWGLHGGTWVRTPCWIKPTPCRANERDHCTCSLVYSESVNQQTSLRWWGLDCRNFGVASSDRALTILTPISSDSAKSKWNFWRFCHDISAYMLGMYN